MDDLGAGALLGLAMGVILGGMTMTVISSVKQTDQMLDLYNKQFCAPSCGANTSGARITDSKFECYCVVPVKP
jgi:hypothetical protein